MARETKAAEPIYKVIFLQQGEVFEIYAEEVTQGGLFGFVEVANLLFGERTQVVVDPSEERLKTEFDGVRRIFIPLHAVVRIDQVPKKGAARITKRQKSDGNLSPFPAPIYTPGDDSRKR